MPDHRTAGGFGLFFGTLLGSKAILLFGLIEHDFASDLTWPVAGFIYAGVVIGVMWRVWIIQIISLIRINWDWAGSDADGLPPTEPLNPKS